jgi:hypothetical protein
VEYSNILKNKCILLGLGIGKCVSVFKHYALKEYGRRGCKAPYIL